MSVKIMADSTSDIGPERVKVWGVTLISLEILFDEEEFLDGADIQLGEFYQRLVSSEKLPATSQPDPETFLTVFQEVKETGGDVVVMTISSDLSGTFQSTTIAKEMCEYDNIYIVDSMQVAYTMPMMMRRDLRLAEEGKSGREIYKILEAEKSHYCIYAAIGDLTCSEEDGRLPKMGAAAGSVLNLKPVITIANTGAVKLAGMAKGQHGTHAKMLKLIENDGGLDFNREMCIGYTGDMGVSAPFKECLEGKMDTSGFVESHIGIAIGIHGGPDCAIFEAYLE